MLILIYLKEIYSSFICVCVAVDLISIDRRSLDREAECLERARVLAAQFMDKVRDSEDHVWKPAGTDGTQIERCVCLCLYGFEESQIEHMETFGCGITA